LDQALTQVFARAPTAPGAVVSTLPPPSEKLPASAPASASTSAPAKPTAAASASARASATAVASPAAGVQPLPNLPPQITDLARDANDHYSRAQDALRGGDFATYGQEMKAVQQDLQRLAELSGTSH
ncbi:MAG: hypothetical protein KGJ86_01830, partial [Chloroflexota bacterium]|nr:hypothetical protein [Chloroflexota bacterium]